MFPCSVQVSYFTLFVNTIPCYNAFFHVIQFFNQDIKNPEIPGPDTPSKFPLITDPVVTWGCHMRFRFLLHV